MKKTVYISGGTLTNNTDPAVSDVAENSVLEKSNTEEVEPKLSPKKISYASLILGILGLLFVPFAALIAIILGHISLSEKYEKTHQGKAKAGIMLGYIHIVILLVLSIILLGAKTIMEGF